MADKSKEEEYQVGKKRSKGQKSITLCAWQKDVNKCAWHRKTDNVNTLLVPGRRA